MTRTTAFRQFSRVLVLVSLAIVILGPPHFALAAYSCSSSLSPNWQICGPIGPPSGLNNDPSVVQASDGTLRMAWVNTGLTGSTSIYYNTRLSNGTWLTTSSITNLGGKNIFPSIVQVSDGTIYAFWSYKATTSTHYQTYYRYLTGSVWSSYTPVPLQNPTSLNDTRPSAALGRDGTLWLVWTRDNSTASGSTPVFRQLWYETMNSTGWSRSEQSITSPSDANWNYQPSVAIGTDNNPRITFSRGQNQIFQINYIQRSGIGWTSPRQIVTSNSTAYDVFPSLIQDRNGTLWVFWARNTSTNFEIRSEYSWDNGTTWRGETQLTAACTGCADSNYPAAVQSSTDKNIWVVYSTNQGTTGYTLYNLVTTSPISPVHHVSISNLLGSYGANASELYAGGLHNPWAFISQSAVVLIRVTVVNLGDFAETPILTMTATNTTNYSLGTQPVSLPVGGSAVVSFSWNTTSVRPARYGFSANVTILGETIGNRGDGALARTNIVHLLPLGDVDQDGSDTLTDVSVFFYNYGFGCSAPGVCSPRYNPFADVNGNGTIDIVDIGVVSKNFDIFT